MLRSAIVRAAMSTFNRLTLQFVEFGDPRKVLKLKREPNWTAPKLAADEALIGWICSPINPLDVNKIQGAYMIKPELPAVGGSEAAGRVLATGSGVRTLARGDLVVWLGSGLPASLWTTHGVYPASELHKVDPRLDPRDAATLMVNPCTAWVMLKEMVDLRENDVVIQNSANSGVGRAVIQLAKALNLKTINIVRDRPDIAALKKSLLDEGATAVYTEEEWEKDARRLAKALPAAPKVALNGVGGKSVLRIANALGHGGTVITYGGMSRKAHEFSTSQLVFRDICVRGVAVGLWMSKPENESSVRHMLKELEALHLAGKMRAPPMDEWSVEEFERAVEKTLSEGQHAKQLIWFGEQPGKKASL